MRRQFGSWFELLQAMGDLTQAESAAATLQLPFLREVEATRMTRSFKMVMLEALQELGGWLKPPTLSALAERSWQVLQRRRPLLADLPAEMAVLADGTNAAWQLLWLGNPVNAWIGGNLAEATSAFFRVEDQRLAPNFSLPADQLEPFSALVQELVDYRLAAYETRRPQEQAPDNVIHLPPACGWCRAVPHRVALLPQPQDRVRAFPDRQR